MFNKSVGDWCVIGADTVVTITYKDSSSTPVTKTVEDFTVELAN